MHLQHELEGSLAWPNKAWVKWEEPLLDLNKIELEKDSATWVLSPFFPSHFKSQEPV